MMCIRSFLCCFFPKKNEDVCNDVQRHILSASDAATRAQEVMVEAEGLQQKIVRELKDVKRDTEEVKDDRATSFFKTFKYAMKLVKREDFEAAGKLPRSSDKNIMYTLLEDISDHERKKCFIIFVSHRWWRGEAPRPNPDVCEKTKFSILVKAFYEAQCLVGDNIQVYIWIDYFCIDQEDRAQKNLGIESLPAYIAASDCLLTPFTDEIFNPRPSPPFSGPLDNYWINQWTKQYYSLSNKETEYLGRAWCRLEMYTGSNAPLPKFGFNFFASRGINQNGRPHFLAGDDGTLKAMPPLSYTFMNTMSPKDGALKDENDLPFIEKIMDGLPKSTVKVGYEGDKNKNGEAHGIGRMVNDDGSRYEGKWEDGEMHGIGIRTKASGERYAGNWEKGRKHGYGSFQWVNGARFDGLVQNDARVLGIYQLPIGHSFQGRYFENKMRSGCMKYKNGDRFEGRFFSPPGGKLFGKEGAGVLYRADGTRVEGEWKDDELHGNAVVIASDGTRVEETWDHGKRCGSTPDA